MTNIFKTPHGEMQQFIQNLHTGGFTYEDVAHIIKQPDLAIKMHTAINPNPPSWWRTPEQQLERASELWPGVILPKPPKEFTPRTESEVLLLHVPDRFDSLWDKVELPVGYTKFRREDVQVDEWNLRLSPGKRERVGCVWLAFDPEHGRGELPDTFWNRPLSMAGPEVFSALIQFPEWPLTWFFGASAPNLAGYQLKHNSVWFGVPAVSLVSDPTVRLVLSNLWANCASEHRASPSVREVLN